MLFPLYSELRVVFLNFRHYMHDCYVCDSLLVALLIIVVWQKKNAIFAFDQGCLSFIFLSTDPSLRGGWMPLVLSTIFLIFMFVWNLGTKRKYIFDLQNKVSMKWILTLGPSLGITRVPGIGLIYRVGYWSSVIFSHFVINLPAFYQVLVFVCTYVPVPYISVDERCLIGQIGPKGYRLYRFIV
uniref:K+ potassium transporter integral membrane domain-containing protein n=1 Tax=Nelumbo nucifera TaxID=4432 RepID=A0A822XIX8_NELNU|nr:TPA_asm: hypothetical protein HUJ06_020554 [Nelumbo nucifera]